jgi:hypothetical protein
MNKPQAPWVGGVIIIATILVIPWLSQWLSAYGIPRWESALGLVAVVILAAYAFSTVSTKIRLKRRTGKG